MESKNWGLSCCDFYARTMVSLTNPQPSWIETTAGSTQPRHSPIPPASSTAPSSSLSAPVSMEDILARIARLEARLETSERRCSLAFTPSRGEADMSFGVQRDWRVLSWDPGSPPEPTIVATAAAPTSTVGLSMVAHLSRAAAAQQAPWDSSWLRSNHEPSHAPRPSRADLHAPWESSWSRIAPECCSNHSDWEYSVPGVSDPPPSNTDFVSCSFAPTKEKRERGLAPFSLGSKVAEGEGDSKMLGAAENQSPNSLNATSGSDNGGGNASNVIQSSAAVINDDELYNWELQADDSFTVTRDVEGEQLGCGTKITPFLKEIQMEYIDARRSNEMQRFKNHKIQEIFDAPNAASDGDMYKKGKWRLNYLLHLTELFAHFAKGSQSASQKKGGERGRHASKLTDEEEEILEVSRGLVIFGIYALEEVYKDLSNLHLEDKVILKGGGVDTLII